MMMHMTFYFGYENVDVLFSGITINTKAGFKYCADDVIAFSDVINQTKN